MSDEDVVEIYQTAGRKSWHHDDVPDGWVCVGWERFEYTESALFRKRRADLTEEDHELIEDYGQIPDEWEHPLEKEGIPEWAKTPPFVPDPNWLSRDDLLRGIQCLRQLVAMEYPNSHSLGYIWATWGVETGDVRDGDEELLNRIEASGAGVDDKAPQELTGT